MQPVGMQLARKTPCLTLEWLVDGLCWFGGVQDGDGSAGGEQYVGAGGGGPVGGVQRHAADILPHHAAEARPVQPRAALQHSPCAGADPYDHGNVHLLHLQTHLPSPLTHPLCRLLLVSPSLLLCTSRIRVMYD